jgi:hypothetical protein
VDNSVTRFALHSVPHLHVLKNKMKMYTLVSILLSVSVHGEIIDDFFASSISFQRTVTNYNSSSGAGTEWSEQESDPKVINGYRRMALSSRSNGTITVDAYRSKLNLDSAGASGELLIYNQAPFEAPVVDMSSGFQDTNPKLVLSFSESSSKGFDILFVIESYSGRILVRTTVPALTDTFTYQIQANEIPNNFVGEQITSIRLFISFDSDTDFTLDYYGLVFNDSAVSLIRPELTAFPTSPNLADAVQVSIPRSELGHNYSLLSTSDLTQPRANWTTVETKSGNGFILNWIDELNTEKNAQFYTIETTLAD